MVKVFSSDIFNETKYFLYDVESGSLLNSDYATFLVAKKRYEKCELLANACKETNDIANFSDNESKENPDRNNKSINIKRVKNPCDNPNEKNTQFQNADFSIFGDKENADYLALEEAEIAEINCELDELEKSGALNSTEKIYEIPFTGEIKALCLHICHDCNLRCPYCFAHEGTYNTEKDYMSKEVGMRAIDFLIKMSGKRKNLEVDFFGGEPLLNMETVKTIVDYAKEQTQKAGKNISFTMTTNGVLLNEENRKYLNDTMDNVVISIDGRKEVHDALRVTPNKKGSHDIALKNAVEFRKIRGDKKYYIRGTFTQNNLDFSRDALYLNDCGFDQISVEPAVLKDDDKLAIKESDLNQVFSEYDALAAEYVKRRKGGKWFNFFHYMLDLKKGPCITKRLRGCGAGSEYVAVTPTGDIYPCHQFVTDCDYYMGSVFDQNFNLDIQKKFFENTVYQKAECKNCVAKYYCSGGCKANSLHFAGDLNKPYKLSCDMMRKRFLNSLAIYAEENP